MAYAVEWTEVASADLAAAAEFIGRDSSFYAAEFVREARLAARSLRQFPERARIMPEANRADIRELFVQNHRLIYQVTKDQVFILAFVHGARDLEILWQRYSKHIPGAA